MEEKSSATIDAREKTAYTTVRTLPMEHEHNHPGNPSLSQYDKRLAALVEQWPSAPHNPYLLAFLESPSSSLSFFDALVVPTAHDEQVAPFPSEFVKRVLRPFTDFERFPSEYPAKIFTPRAYRFVYALGFNTPMQFENGIFRIPRILLASPRQFDQPTCTILSLLPTTNPAEQVAFTPDMIFDYHTVQIPKEPGAMRLLFQTVNRSGSFLAFACVNGIRGIEQADTLSGIGYGRVLNKRNLSIVEGPVQPEQHVLGVVATRDARAREGSPSLTRLDDRASYDASGERIKTSIDRVLSIVPLVDIPRLLHVFATHNIASWPIPTMFEDPRLSETFWQETQEKLLRPTEQTIGARIGDMRKIRTYPWSVSNMQKIVRISLEILSQAHNAWHHIDTDEMLQARFRTVLYDELLGSVFEKEKHDYEIRTTIARFLLKDDNLTKDDILFTSREEFDSVYGVDDTIAYTARLLGIDPHHLLTMKPDILGRITYDSALNGIDIKRKGIYYHTFDKHVGSLLRNLDKLAHTRDTTEIFLRLQEILGYAIQWKILLGRDAVQSSYRRHYDFSWLNAFPGTGAE